MKDNFCLAESQRNAVKAKYKVSITNNKNQLINTLNIGLHEFEIKSDSVLMNKNERTNLMPNKDLKLRFVIDNPVINDFKKLVNKKNTAILCLLSTINNSLPKKVY